MDWHGDVDPDLISAALSFRVRARDVAAKRLSVNDGFQPSLGQSRRSEVGQDNVDVLILTALSPNPPFALLTEPLCGGSARRGQLKPSLASRSLWLGLW